MIEAKIKQIKKTIEIPSLATFFILLSVGKNS
jgi:hypothetical protein